MGDLAELKTDLFVPWTGGKPTSDWKGLSSSARNDRQFPQTKHTETQLFVCPVPLLFLERGYD
eukprot:scaffold133237_cov41-Attheya_sp.AAC.4